MNEQKSSSRRNSPPLPPVALQPEARIILRDLIEVYNERLKAFGKGTADWKFIIDVLLLFRRGIIKPVRRYRNLNTYGMCKNYLKIGWRNLLKNNGYAMRLAAEV